MARLMHARQRIYYEYVYIEAQNVYFGLRQY